MASSTKALSGKTTTLIVEGDHTGAPTWKPSVGETLVFRKTNGRGATYKVESNIGRGCVGCDVRASKFDALCDELLCAASQTILKKS